MKFLHRELDILLNHNKQHIGAVETTVEDYADELKTNVEGAITTYLSKAGLTGNTSQLAEQALNAALTVIKEAYPASTVVVSAVEAAEPEVNKVLAQVEPPVAAEPVLAAPVEHE